MTSQEVVENTGLPDFPETKPPHAVDREIICEDGRFGDLGKLKLTIYRVGFQIQREFRNDFEPWLRYYKAKIETADNKRIGQLVYRLINGDFIDDFQDELQMSELGAQELEEVGSLLFEKNGALQKKWRVGEEAGTGIFGDDLNATGTKCALLNCTDQAPRGDFIMVDDQYRRRGIGSWALQQLFHILHDEGVKFIVSRPSVPRLLPNLRGTATEEPLIRRNIAFLRKLGFRRVGLSPVFAYVLSDDDHPSRHLAIASDIDPQSLI